MKCIVQTNKFVTYDALPGFNSFQCVLGLKDAVKDKRLSSRDL